MTSALLATDVDVIRKFAQFEYKHGEPWHGQSLFESLVRAYPSRGPLWTMYAQAETAAGNPDVAT